MIERLILVRHAETVHNVRGIAQGWSDSDLSELGARQVEWVSERLAEFAPTEIYSSTLPRALTTARAIAARLKMNVVAVEDLREMNCGSWEGMSFGAVREGDRAYYERWMSDPAIPCPDGESFDDVLARVRGFLERLTSASEDSAARPLIVSHGTAIRIAATALLGMPLSAARQLALYNAAINIFDHRNGRFVLERWNDAAHCGIESRS